MPIFRKLGVFQAIFFSHRTTLIRISSCIPCVLGTLKLLSEKYHFFYHFALLCIAFANSKFAVGQNLVIFRLVVFFIHFFLHRTTVFNVYRTDTKKKQFWRFHFFSKASADDKYSICVITHTQLQYGRQNNLNNRSQLWAPCFRRAHAQLSNAYRTREHFCVPHGRNNQ